MNVKDPLLFCAEESRMKREKIIAAVLAASMALSLTGCDSDNENVIKAAEDYAEAHTI